MSDFLDRIRQLSPQRLMLLAMELHTRLETAEAAQNDPIAVIGLGLRFPGGAHDAQSFWRLLSNGIDAIQEIPASRFDIDQYYDPDPEKPGKISTRWGGFVEPIDQFEPQFFGITPREALTMDPQQRLVLEVAWEALENAGYAPDRLSGSRTGVFLGACNNDYFQLLLQAGEQAADMYLSTGNAHSVLSGRVSYVLGLQGPSLTVDTACSSSLTAIHQAYLSLKKGDCRMALAGGVNVILSPDTYIALSRAKMLAPDGRCKAFDASGDGFVRSEGCGILVLKRLSHAQADGDRVLAIIRGSAINQDGRSNGLTAPNGPSQVAVIQAALAEARLSPWEIGYVETHGTGTSLGDPIEVQALGEALGQGRTKEQPVLIGSVKTNLGHLESAAGVAGVIKLILGLLKRQIPPSLHFHRPNPYINWDRLPVAVPTQLTDWQPINGRWIGGVSSFGFSGTNVHMILEAAPVVTGQPNPVERPLHPLRLSARSQTALKAQAARLRQHLVENPSVSLPDVCFTQNAGRASLPRRLVLLAATLEEAQQKLAEVADSEETPSFTAPVHPPRVAFLFSGSGAQWAGMGRQLYETQPIFRKCMQECEEQFRPYLPEPLLSIIYPQPGVESSLDRFLYTQAATFAIEYALAELWKSWGVTPDVVLGHSLGEYAAAVTAGVLRLEDGVRLVAARGRLLESLAETGTMYAVFAPKEQVEEIVAGFPGQVSIAAINGPESIVISGRSAATAEAVERFEKAGVKSRRLAISQAAHSPLIDPILDEFEELASGIPYAAPQIDLVSCLLGRPAREEEICHAAYWRRHLREPVQFADAIRSIPAGDWVYIEIGPDPVLIGMARRFLVDKNAVWAPSLSKGKPDWPVILESLASVYVHGVEVDWAGFDSPYRRSRLALPTYPFERQRYWIEPDRKGGGRRSPARGGDHPLLGKQILSPIASDWIFETHIRRDAPAFLEHHRVFDVVILPSPAFLEMAWTAGERVFGPGLHGIENFSVQAALEIPEEGERTVQVIVKPPQNDRAAFQIYSLDGTGPDWTLHASGEIVKADGRSSPEDRPFNPDEVRSRCAEEIAGGDYYARLAGLGLEFGPNFQGIDQVWRRDGEALARVRLPAALGGEAGGYHFHPAFLDACFHLLGVPVPAEELERAYLLIGIDRLSLYCKPGQVLWNHTILKTSNSETLTAACRIYDAGGRLVAEVSGLLLKSAAREALLRSMKKLPEDWAYLVAWQPAGPATRPELPRRPSASEVASALAVRAAINEDEPDYASYARLSPRLEALCAARVAQALEKLGWPLTPGRSFGLDELVKAAGILPRYRRLLSRMLEMLASQGVLREDGETWTVTRAAPGPEAGEEEEALARVFPAYRSEIDLVARCAGSLAEVLCGRQDPLALLFPGGSLEMTGALYSRSPYARLFNALIAEAAALCIPTQGTIRVLEIGAGTGSTTAALLPLLPAERTVYTFSDISPLFVERARETFREYPFVSYQLFDIEQDPGAQGLAEQSYDIVLAANVLHATVDLRRSLEHVRRLLKPGGLALILEGTRKEGWVDLTFGLTEGWWRFADSPLRTHHPLLSRPDWLALLAGSGFVEAVSLPGPEIDSISGQVLFLAQSPASIPAGGEGGWLVFADPSGLGEALAERLCRSGEPCRLVYPGLPAPAQAAAQAENGWQIDPRDPAGYEQVVRQFGGPGQPPLRGIVYLWELDAEGSLSTVDLPPCTPALYLVQALKAIRQPAPPSIWLVTRGAQPVNGETLPVINKSAALWGLGRTLWLEHPELGGGLVDLDPHGNLGNDLDSLLDALYTVQGEDQVAYRGGQRFVPRLLRASLPPRQPAPWKADGSYLITGGLGGLGLKIAQFCARRGAGCLVLLSRRGLPTRDPAEQLAPENDLIQKYRIVREIEAMGVKVITLAVDVSDPAAMAALFEQFGAGLPPLRGIIHAAADLSNRRIDALDAQTVEAMFRPKVDGTLLLHRLSLGHPLDFFVLFSSSTALLGSQDLAHYAAANSFLDAFAHFRRSQGLPAISVNWGTWDTMRVATQAEQQRVTQFGLNQMPADLALEVLETLLSGEAGAQMMVASVNWDTLKAAYEARRRRPFLEQVENIRRATRATDPVQASPAEAGLLERLQQVRAEDRYPLLVSFVSEQVAHVIGVSGDGGLDEHQGLFEMGLDSLMSVELKSRLEAEIGQALPSTLTFNYPTIAELAGFLLERLALAQQGSTTQASPEPAESSTVAGQTVDIDDLSEDDLVELLSKTLKNTEGTAAEEKWT